MRIHAIHVERFLSFDDFHWLDIDPRLNVLVGANGAGKTNVMHAVRAVFDVVSHDRYEASVAWSGLLHRDADPQTMEIGIDVEFAEKAEQELLSTFLAASFCDEGAMTTNPAPSGLPNVDRDAYYYFSQMLHRRFASTPPSWLFKGRLVAYFNGRQWFSHYAAYDEAGPWFNLGLSSARGASVLYGEAADTPQGAPSIFALWRRALADDDRALLDRCLSRLDHSCSLPLPDPESVYALAPKSGVHLTVQPPTNAISQAHRAFATAAGLTLQDGHTYELRWVFQRLLERSLVFTDNVRRAPGHRFSRDQLNNPSVELNDGERLALFLFNLMTGTEKEKVRFDNVRDIFARLTRRRFDVSMRRPQIGPSPAAIDRENALIDVDVIEPAGRVPLAYSGAGVSEALFLSAVMAGGTGRVVLLDEPASTLHPTMQTSLLAEIQRHAHTQFLLSTHSPHLISPDALEKVSRVAMRGGATTRAAVDAARMGEDLWIQLCHELRGSTDARALLFNHAVILVEGETEARALPVWFQKLGYSLAARDIAMYSVGSDQNFTPLVAFLHQLAIPWAIVCDGKVIADPQPPAMNIAQQLERAGIASVPSLEGLDFEGRCSALTPLGVLTLARDGTQEIEGLPIFQAHRAEANRKVGRSKARQGYYIAETYECPDEVKGLLGRIRTYLSDKTGDDA